MKKFTLKALKFIKKLLLAVVVIILCIVVYEQIKSPTIKIVDQEVRDN